MVDDIILLTRMAYLLPGLRSAPYQYEKKLYGARAHAKSPSIISPNPYKLISKVSEPSDLTNFD